MNKLTKILIVILIAISIFFVLSGTVLGVLVIIKEAAKPTASETLAGVDSFNKFNQAATSSVIQVGPQVDVRVAATSSKRAYLRLENMGTNIPIYCRADQDKIAVVQQGILIGTSTPFEINNQNLYYGSIRCTSTASTTLAVNDYVSI